LHAGSKLSPGVWRLSEGAPNPTARDGRHLLVLEARQADVVRPTLEEALPEVVAMAVRLGDGGRLKALTSSMTSLKTPLPLLS
jgi:hypothetical protein